MTSPQSESKYGTALKNIQVCHRQIKKVQEPFQDKEKLETYPLNQCGATIFRALKSSKEYAITKWV